MRKERLEAFSDGVIAILITIMVLELRAPHGAGLRVLRPLLPSLATYLVSFVYLGIYWANHHHLLQAARHVDGRVLWANLHLLFWLSLVPFATGWMADSGFAPVPVAAYGVVLLLAAVAWLILQASLISLEGPEGEIAAALGRDVKGKLSFVLYLVAIVAAFFARWVAEAIYVGVALMWLVPDRRIESRLAPRAAGAAAETKKSPGT